MLAGACLLLTGLAQAGAQFLPGPGQSAPGAKEFPPPPGQSATFPPPPGQSAGFPPPPVQSQSQSFPAPPARSQAFPPPGTQSPSVSGLPSGPTSLTVGPAGGPGGGQFSPAATRADQVCGGFQALGQDMEKSLQAVNAAGERKATREEACPLFKNLSSKEVKALKFLETNRQLCSIPQSFIKQLQDRHAQIAKITKVVCSAGPQPGAGPGPSLSDALGGPTIADDTTVKTGRGTFDTLTGNALQR